MIPDDIAKCTIIDLLRTNDQLRSTIANSVLKELSSSAEKPHIFSILKKYIDTYPQSLSGFKNKSKAPVGILLKLLQHELKQPKFMLLLANAWILIDSEFRERVITFLEKRDIPCNFNELIDPFKFAQIEKSTMDELVQAFSAEYPQYSIDYITLAFGVLIDATPLEEDAENGDIKELINLSGFLEKVLEYFRTLPIDSDDWDQVETLFAAIKTIRQEKETANEGEEIEKLTQALNSVKNEKRGLVYYKAIKDDIEAWKVELCKESCRPEATKHLNSLAKKLILIGNPKPAFESWEEEERWTDERKILKAEIDELRSNITPLFSKEFSPSIESFLVEHPDTDKDKTVHQPKGQTSSTSDVFEPDSILEEGELLDKPKIISSPEDDDASEIIELHRSQRSDNLLEDISEIDLAKDICKNDDKGSPKGKNDRTEKQPTKKKTETQQKEVRVNILKDIDLTICSLIEKDDICGAFWLSNLIEENGDKAAVPSWLLKGVVGTRLVSYETTAYLSELSELPKLKELSDDLATRLLGISAALPPLLKCQVREYIAWLLELEGIDGADVLLSEVRDFATTGVALLPKDMFNAVGAEKWQQAISDTVSSLKDYSDSLSSRTSRFHLASEIFRHISSDNSKFKKFLRPAINDEREKVNIVLRELEKWKHQDYLIEYITSIGKEMKGKKYRSIVGGPRQHLLTNLDEGIRLVIRWCDLIKQERDKSFNGQWREQRVINLRNVFRDCLPRVYNSLDNLSVQEGNPLARAAAICLRRTLFELQDWMDIEQIPTTPPEAGFPWNWLRGQSNRLDVSIGQRLIYIPSIHLNNDCQPLGKADKLIDKVKEGLSHRIDALSLAKAWYGKGDFRFRNILDKIANMENILDSVQRVETDEKLRHRLDLKRLKSKIEAQVEKAFIDGISTEDRAEYTQVLEAIRPEETENFWDHYKELCNIESRLIESRNNRIEYCRDRWGKMTPKLETSTMGEKKKKQITEFIAYQFEQSDIRVLDEALSYLENYLDSGKEPDDSFFESQKPRRDILNEFLTESPNIVQWLNVKSFKTLSEKAAKGLTECGIIYGKLTQKRRDEVKAAFEAWTKLKKATPHFSGVPDNISIILKYLGFSLSAEQEKEIPRGKSGPDWWYGQFSMSAGDLSRPIPQFGSLTKGCYQVVCLWERPDSDIIAARLETLGLKRDNAIILFLGRLTDRQRRKAVGINQDKNLAICVLDETLLVFLSGEQDARLPALIHCSLPFSALNPYTPFKAGDVPPEIFYGRDRMIRQLQEPGESCFVYGGRQLGKSALLRRVENEFHRPERERYAKVIDIKLLGDPASSLSLDILWQKIRDAFKEFGLFKQSLNTFMPDKLIGQIKSALLELPERQVLLMLDEADKFLAADAEASFSNVENLRILMAETGRRFKVVFTGLQNVQSYQGIPNQPLAHFGTPLCVGPLEPEAARQLVEAPLHALGFRMSDDSTVLRILSYTNYHPGLIQIFCHKLVHRFHEKPWADMPPYYIDQSVVDNLYPDIYESIRERFNWTLALNQQYQAIAWGMIIEQMDSKDSYSKAFSDAEIWELANYWWREGFIDYDIGALKGRLDEMVGLGVLVRNSTGHYRLRSPNIVRIMGNRDTIIAEMDALINRAPDIPFKAEQHHKPLDENASAYSPLTYAQEKRLNVQSSGVGMVFATPALGLEFLDKAMDGFVIKEQKGNDAFIEKVDLKNSGGDLKATLQHLWEKHKNTKAIMVMVSCEACSPEAIHNMVRDAINFSNSRQTKNRWIRINFLCNPDATYAWLNIKSNDWEQLEAEIGLILWPHKYSELGVKQRLQFAQNDLMYTPDRCRAIVDATGGWPYLLDVLFEHCGKQIDPLPEAKKLREKLADKQSGLSQDFRLALGLEAYQDAKRLFIQMMSYLGKEEHALPFEFYDDFAKQFEESGIYENRFGILQFLIRTGVVSVNLEQIIIDPVVKIAWNN